LPPTTARRDEKITCVPDYRGNKGNPVVGGYYRPLDQGEPADKAFLLQLCACRLSSYRVTSTTPTSAGKVARQAAGNQGDS